MSGRFIEDCSAELVVGSDNRALAEDALRRWELLRNEPPEPSMEQLRWEFEQDMRANGEVEDE